MLKFYPTFVKFLKRSEAIGTLIFEMLRAYAIASLLVIGLLGTNMIFRRNHNIRALTANITILRQP